MAPRGRGLPFNRTGTIPLLLAALLAAGGCGGDDQDPTKPHDPQTVVVITAEQLIQALATAVSGDTIQLRAEFSSTEFRLPGPITLTSTQSPVRLVGVARSTFRPEIIFEDTTRAGLTFAGHSGSSVADLDFRGGLDAIHLDNSAVTLSGLNIREVRRDGVSAEGSGSGGAVSRCFIEAPPRYGVLIDGGSTLVERNTIVDAGATGIRITGEAPVAANNVYRARLGGIFVTAAGAAALPGVSCNNAFATVAGPDYASDPAGLISLTANFALDPKFCAGSWTISEISPLAPLNSGGCGLIGAFGIGCAETDAD